MRVVILVLLQLLTTVQCATDDQQTPLHAELLAARVAEPAKVVDVLRELRLDSSTHWHRDVDALNADEQAQMVRALERGGVQLGDRSRLRIWVESGGVEGQLGALRLKAPVDVVVTKRAL